MTLLSLNRRFDSDNKEGGDWSTDIQEAVNMFCFTMHVYSNLVGSVPGKSQSNNSGSDKRELYTIAQALQKPYHDLLFTVHQMIIRFNQWSGCKVDVPFIQLTTLNKHCDAQEVTIGRCDAANIRMQTHEVARASSQQESPQQRRCAVSEPCSTK